MAAQPIDITGKKILIAGPSGQVAQPLVSAWAGNTELWALARFSNDDDRQQFEAQGVRTIKADLADRHTLQNCPDDFDYVVNMAVVKSGDFDYDLRANAEGVGNLMARCHRAKGFLHVSSTAVYEYGGAAPRKESDPLGDNHRLMYPTYSLAKIAAESVCRFVGRHYAMPTLIARLSVPYGNNGGWPYYHLLMMQNGTPIDVHPERPNTYNLLHSDDYIDKIPYLLAAASPDVVTVNFGGSQPVSIEEWCGYLQELSGFEPIFRDNPRAFGALSIDTTLMHELIGPTRVDWRQGIRDMVQNLAPELIQH